jgi:hypothetical protein
MITGAISEEILSRMDTGDDEDYGSVVIPLKNHIDPLKPEIGSITVGHDIGITSLESNDNKDYANAIRVDLTVVQSIIDPNQQMVDLSKDIKWSYTINL